MTRQTSLAAFASIAVASCVAASVPLLAEPASRPGTPPAPTMQRTSGNAEPLSIDVYPRIASDGYVSVRMRVEPHALSRNLEVSWWSDEGLGGSRVLEVEGDRGAIRYEFPIKRIDPGEYEVSAVLIRSDGTRIRRSATVLVVGRGF